MHFVLAQCHWILVPLTAALSMLPPPPPHYPPPWLSIPETPADSICARLRSGGSS